MAQSTRPISSPHGLQVLHLDIAEIFRDAQNLRFLSYQERVENVGQSSMKVSCPVLNCSRERDVRQNGMYDPASG
jgi:hypothetical protein